MPLLAIESTCDETAAAVIGRDRSILSSVVASQEKLHARWKGVVPEVASRAHVERIIPVIDEALGRAGVDRENLVAVAVAIQPGLAGSLLVGLSAAKAIAAVLGIPIVGYNHVAAHLYACRISHGVRLRYPCIGLVASGGHTTLFHMFSPLELSRLGGTIDDAAGEAFDKAASLLVLGYPGGPEIERVDLSFSGLKTALRYQVRPVGGPVREPPRGKTLADLAASFQQAVVDSIVAKVDLARRRTGCSTLAVGGGVASNTLLRAELIEWGKREGVDVLVPPPALCTDNAVMGAIAWERIEKGDFDSGDLDITAGTER